MPTLRQLEFIFRAWPPVGHPGISPDAERPPAAGAISPDVATEARLAQTARELLRANDAETIASQLRVEWNSRLKTAAGRADYRRRLISLNPLLREYPAEIDRTLRHELAHLLAQFRAGRRRIPPHGREWQQACSDLGIAGEKRCHDLPFPVRQRARRFLYRCPNCGRGFSRVRRIRAAVACLACCRRYNGGKFDGRFRLVLTQI